MPATKDKNKALLVLENGQIFEGIPFGFSRPNVFGEVVFNTAMTGYQEALTDPSYAGQILTMTYPLVGNYAVNKDEFESKKIHVRGFIVSELCTTPSHFKSFETLDKFLREYKIPGIYNIDTRALAQAIRTKGVMKGRICSANADARTIVSEINKRSSPDADDLLPEVTVQKPEIWNEKGAHKIVVIDTGVKYNILRSLAKRDCKVTVVPADTNFDKIMAYNPEGIIISNGPGDPSRPRYVIETAKQATKEANIPIFGICLGNQILALAAGAKTFKLKFGHRGANHPVKDLETGRVHITTQNHGFAVDADSLKNTDFKISKLNLNDNSVEGMVHKSKPIFSVQYHPEGGPGPQDNQYLFDNFLKMVKTHAKKN